MKKKSRYLYIVLLLLLPILLVGCELQDQPKATYPEMAVSLRSKESSNGNIKLEWIVENRSDQNITFKENNIQLFQLDGKDYPYPLASEAMVLKPGEIYRYQFNLNLSDGIHSLSMTARCEEGTQGTFNLDVTIPKS